MIAKNPQQDSNSFTSRLQRWRWLIVGGALGALVFACWHFLPPSGEHSVPTTHVTEAPSKPIQPQVDSTQPPSSAPEGMVWIPGGTFYMGTEQPGMDDGRPIHPVRVDGFWMDKTEVTNEQFAAFVKATDYVTIAERKPSAEEFPNVPEEKLKAGSIVFTPPEGKVDLNQPLRWWRWQESACWKYPEGPGSDLRGREKHPVVQVCWEDAVAYAKWAKKRLPTEAEWEYAARGGLDRKRFCWGDEFRPDGKWMANTWQGHFPYQNSADDGFRGTAPAGSYPANGFGLYDMAGNVWEWCQDWYRPDYYETLPADKVTANPKGPSDSYDPNEPNTPKRVQRGGSFLCSDEYCMRYLPGARGKGEPKSAASHIGFRCVRSPDAP